MAQFWDLVQSLRGQALSTPSGHGSFTVLDVGDRGLKLQVRGGGIYNVPRSAIEAAADLPGQVLSAARIRALGISESQPSYVAGIVRATRNQASIQTDPVQQNGSSVQTGTSKYDSFWSTQLAAIRTVVGRAARGEDATLDASPITAFGNRASWAGSVDVTEETATSGEMAHMASLGRLVAASGMCRAYPSMTLHFAMNSAGRLRIAVRPEPARPSKLRNGTGSQAQDLEATALPASTESPTRSMDLNNLQLSATHACEAVHRIFSGLPAYRDPGQVQFRDGLYVFYEERERSAHVEGARIVRVGNHPRTDGRLIARLKEHYLTRRDAKNGSVFRLLLGGALIRRDDPDSSCLLPSPGQGHWEKHMLHECDRCASYEEHVTEFLRTECAFRCIRIEDRAERNLFEALLVATVAQCTECGPSESWLGSSACSEVVRRSGLWNRDFVDGATLTEPDLRRLEQLVAESPGTRTSDRADLGSTLLLIPCSAGKEGWTDPKLSVRNVRDLISSELAPMLDEGRQLAFARTSIDLSSPTRPAIATYSGYPYSTPDFRELLVSHLRRGLHCLIVSGGYGLLRPEEPIHGYDAYIQQTRGIWAGRMPVLLRDYVARNGIRRTFGVFSGSYSSVIPDHLTRQDWRSVEAFEPTVDEGSPMRAVPRKVGATLMRVLESEYEIG